MHQHFTVADDVLFADIGNYTVNITGDAIAWQISAIYYGAGRTERCRNDCHIEYTLSQTIHSQNGTVGSKVLYQISTDPAIDARAKRFTSRFGRKENQLRH